jgi:hypothetical protein
MCVDGPSYGASFGGWFWRAVVHEYLGHRVHDYF